MMAKWEEYSKYYNDAEPILAHYWVGSNTFTCCSHRYRNGGGGAQYMYHASNVWGTHYSDTTVHISDRASSPGHSKILSRSYGGTLSPQQRDKIRKWPGGEVIAVILWPNVVSFCQAWQFLYSNVDACGYTLLISYVDIISLLERYGFHCWLPCCPIVTSLL